MPQTEEELAEAKEKEQLRLLKVMSCMIAMIKLVESDFLFIYLFILLIHRWFSSDN